MRIHVTTLGAKPHTFSFESARASIGPWNRIFVVCLPRFPDLADLDALWQQREGMLPSAAHATFFRIHPGDEALFLRQAGTVTAGVELLQRRARMPLYAVHWENDQHVVSALTGDDHVELSVADNDDLVATLREAELRAYAAEKRAWFPKSNRIHYLGPNGLHYSSYFRVASALQGPDELDGVSFWLLPYVTASTVVLLDTSTVSVIGLHLAQYLREIGGDGPQHIELVQPLRGYDESAREVSQRRIEAAVPDRRSRRHALVLVSIVGTGQLALRGRQLAQQMQFDEVTVVGLYGGPSEVDAAARGRLDAILCALPESIGRTDGADCPDCSRKPRGSSPALPVSRDSYLLHVSHARAATEISIPVLLGASELMMRYPGSQAFTVHRDEPAIGLSRRPRHHGIYIDVGKLTDHPTFKQRFEDLLDTIKGQVDVILAPEHATAQLLARRAGERLQLPVVLRNAENLERASTLEREHLQQPRMLIVDDAIITGGRLLGYREALLAAGFSPNDVHVAVGFLRPDSQDSREGIANLVHEIGRSGERKLHAVEELLLPHMQGPHCPWCWEQHLLQAHGRTMEEISQSLITRADELLRVDTGLVDNLFWGWESDQFPLGPGSVLGSEELSQAQLFTIVASGFQTLRSRGDLDEDPSPPVSKVLRPEFWLNGRFYAPPITASILRAAHAHDLTAPIAGHRYKSRVNERFEDLSSKNLRLEFLLAVVAGKLPLVEGVASVLTEAGVDDGIFAFFDSQIPGLLDAE